MEVKDSFMNNDTTASPKPKSPLKQASMRKRPGLLILLVAVLITSLILSHLFISLLISGSEIEITASKLQSDKEYSTDYTQVTVDLILYNPGRQRGTTVWVEITDQPTNVSFSKTQYVFVQFSS